MHPPARDRQTVKGPGDAANVVDCLAHRRADIRHHDHRPVPAAVHLAGQILVVDLAMGVGADHHGVHGEPVDHGGYAMVRGPRVVDDAVGKPAAGQPQGMLGTLARAAGDIAPPVAGRGAQQVRHEADDLTLLRLGVVRVRAVGQGVAEVVEHEVQKRCQRLEVQVAGGREADVGRPRGEQGGQQLVEFSLDSRVDAGRADWWGGVRGHRYLRRKTSWSWMSHCQVVQNSGSKSVDSARSRSKSHRRCRCLDVP